MFFSIVAVDLGALTYYIDTAHGTHDNFKSEAGSASSMGHGIFCSMSISQKLIANSSTETKLVGVANYLSNALHAKRFLQAQGVVVRNFILQDNQDATLMEMNGTKSSSKQSREPHVRCFYITNAIKRQEVEFSYCLAKVMLAYLFTNPPQGTLFLKCRAILFDHVPIDILCDINYEAPNPSCARLHPR